MARHDMDAAQLVSIVESPRKIRSTPPALLLLALAIAPAKAAAPATFVLHASGFETALVADDRGRLIQSAPGRPQPLVPGRWLAVDFDTKRSVWFDDTGRVTRSGPYVEIRSGALARHPSDPDSRTLFSAWSSEGTALLHADGSPFIEWQPGSGEWTVTPHPQRYSWRARDAGERIFDEKGQLRLQLKSTEHRAAGPFPGRTQYLICDISAEAPCALRDEAGTTLWTAHVTDLVPLENGGWLAREGQAWRRRDKNGQLSADPSEIYLARASLSGSGRDADDVVVSWPQWMTEYRIAREEEAVFSLHPDSERGGLMQSDGRFVPITGAHSGGEVCPGIWRFRMTEGVDQLADATGRGLGPFTAFAWKEPAGWPALRIAVADNGQETLIDCHARKLVDTPPLHRLTAEPAGLLGTLADESEPRLWLDADLRQHLLPEGSDIEAVSHDGSLLVVQTRTEGLRLYHVKHGRFVGAAFGSAEVLLNNGLVFHRDGYYGFMDAEGIERLPPRYKDVMPWGEDRLWSTRYLEEGSANQLEVLLHRMDGSIIQRWTDVSVSDSPILRNLPNQGPVTELIGTTIETPRGTYFGQQWVDRDGRTLFLSMECNGMSRENEGSVIEPLNGKPRHRGTPCVIPNDIRAKMAATTTPP